MKRKNVRGNAKCPFLFDMMLCLNRGGEKEGGSKERKSKWRKGENLDFFIFCLSVRGEKNLVLYFGGLSRNIFPWLHNYYFCHLKEEHVPFEIDLVSKDRRRDEAAR